jgi:hypothetical protein
MMSAHPDLFYNTYANFTGQVLASVREAAFGVDIGQNSWVTAAEYEGFMQSLRVSGESHVLEIASGSGGPALHLCRKAGCRVTGVDANGAVTNEELAARSSIGLFVFVPKGMNEELIVKAGFTLVSHTDVTENAALVSRRWREARQRFRDDLLRLEGAENFEGVQEFLGAVHRLSSERRLSRIAYVAEK